VDVPGEEQREQRCVSLGTFPTKTLARQAANKYMVANNVNSIEALTSIMHSVTFRVQADMWLTSLRDPHRRRGPVAQATYSAAKDAIDDWLNPNIGEKQLHEVDNEALRDLITLMLQRPLSSKTICNYIQIAKSVVASAVDSKGNQLHPRTWNNDFMRLPVVDEKKQNRPKVTAKEVLSIVGHDEEYSALYLLLAGTGLRIGEALSIRVGVQPSEDYSYITDDCRMVYVNKSIWRGTEQDPKTMNAIRVVDLAPPLADVLQTYVDKQQRKSNLLFQSSNGSFLSQRNLLRDSLHPAAKNLGRKFGFHVFRRFRASVLREHGVLEDLVKLWLGHANENITDVYAEQLKKNVDLRQHWAVKAGLGFDLPTSPLVVQRVQPNTENVPEHVAA
jgi:integrase